MSQVPTIQVPFPKDQFDRLEAEAKAMGLTVPAYINFVIEARKKGADAAFQDAAKYVFKSYPQTLKKLAQ